MRPVALLKLLKSVEKQTLYPDEILIIDASTNDETKEMISNKEFRDLVYVLVEDEERGLTKQRNKGISLIDKQSEVLCFLDDDTELMPNYFEEVISSFKADKDVVGVGGLAINENRWCKKEENKQYSSLKYYQLDNYVIKESSRNVIRNYLNLNSDALPSIMPSFSNGRTYGYPLNGKTYEVDLLVGMSFSFRTNIFKHINFSTYFEGYGLYEDADFCLRALKYGKNVINTNAQLYHFHDPSGRPNKYKYGKMVIRNGWYVWRIKYPKPSLSARIKWNLIAWVLTTIRATNILNTNKRYEAFTEALGRVAGWFSLLFNKPKIER